MAHKVGVFDWVGQQDQRRGVFVVVKLGKKGFHDLWLFRPRAGFWVKVAVAPALVRADEEDLHAGLAVVEVQGDDIGLFHPARVDALALLHLGQGLDPVA